MAAMELMDVSAKKNVETEEELLYLLVFVWSRGSEVELRHDL